MSPTSRSSHAPDRAPAAGPPKVAIVSADPLVRAGLASMLEPDLDPACIVDSLDQADVALWDTGAAPDRVLDHMARIDTAAADVPVLVVVPSAAFAGPALDAGAGGVMLRDRLGDGLVAALDAVRHGFVVLDPALVAAVVEAATGAAPAFPAGPPAELDPDLPVADDSEEDAPGAAGARGRPDEPGIDALTARERQVIDLLAQGLSNRRIAAALSISEHTAKFHVNGIMSKLGASTRTEAVVEAVRRGLVLL